MWPHGDRCPRRCMSGGTTSSDGTEIRHELVHDDVTLLLSLRYIFQAHGKVKAARTRDEGGQIHMREKHIEVWKW